MSIGTVKWFSDEKGVGYITPDDGGKDVFAHVSAIQGRGVKSLRDHQKVSFEVTTGPKTKGHQAANIRPLDEIRSIGAPTPELHSSNTKPDISSRPRARALIFSTKAQYCNRGGPEY